MDLYDDIRGWSPIQFFTPTDRASSFARVIARYVFLVQRKLIDREKSRSPSRLFHCNRSRARNIKKAAACELIGAKKGCNFQLNLFIWVILHIYFIPHILDSK